MLRATRIERQVRSMHDEVKHPMADHERGEHQRTAGVAANSEMDSGDQRSPRAHHQQAVRIRVVHKVQWRMLSTRIDMHALDAQHEQRRPKKIDELGRQKEGAKRYSRCGCLCTKANAEMTDKHLTPF